MAILDRLTKKVSRGKTEEVAPHDGTLADIRATTNVAAEGELDPSVGGFWLPAFTWCAPQYVVEQYVVGFDGTYS